MRISELWSTKVINCRTEDEAGVPRKLGRGGSEGLVIFIGSGWWHRHRKKISGWREPESELSAQIGEGGDCSTASGTRGR